MTEDHIARIGPEIVSNAIMSPQNAVTLMRMARLSYALSARVRFTLPEPLISPACSDGDYIVMANIESVPTDSEGPE